jgi:hypothetical protein
MGKVLARKIYDDLSNLKVAKKQNKVKSDNFFDGHVVRERMLEIVNAVA